MSQNTVCTIWDRLQILENTGSYIIDGNSDHVAHAGTKKFFNPICDCFDLNNPLNRSNEIDPNVHTYF